MGDAGYAGRRVCWDADSHLMPEPDFLSRHADPAQREALWIGGGANGGAEFEKRFGEMIAHVRARLADGQKTAELEENVIASAKGWYAHGAVDATERSRTLDLLGFRGQLVFSTFAGAHLRARDPELLYGGTRAHTRAMAEFCSDDPRLMAVAMIPLDDPARALDELAEALRLGCRAVQVPSDAPGGDRKGFSPSHVDLEPFWARLAEARVPVVLHIGGGKLIPRAYHRNGHPRPTDWLGGGENLRGKDFPALCHSPQNFLTALVLDGVFDRHPELRCGVIELGAAWVPGFVRNLDAAHRSFHKHEPLLKSLSMKPSDFIHRQVRFTPFPFEDVGWLIQQSGDDLFLFSSDYPHPEGGRDPIARFEASMDEAGIGPAARDRFYSGNFADWMGVGD
jgi:predicted TIM-barrel fold metal-dependent hydrolase